MHDRGDVHPVTDHTAFYYEPDTRDREHCFPAVAQALAARWQPAVALSAARPRTGEALARPDRALVAWARLPTRWCGWGGSAAAGDRSPLTGARSLPDTGPEGGSLDWNACPRVAEGVEISKVAEGYIIYRAECDRVHYLNHTAVLLLELCTGPVTAA